MVRQPNRMVVALVDAVVATLEKYRVSTIEAMVINCVFLQTFLLHMV